MCMRQDVYRPELFGFCKFCFAHGTSLCGTAKLGPNNFYSCIFYFLLCDALHIAEYTHRYHSSQCPVLYFLHYLCVNNQTSIFLDLSSLWSIFEKINELKYVLHYVKESR
jgi:hypothetical protein